MAVDFPFFSYPLLAVFAVLGYREACAATRRVREWHAQHDVSLAGLYTLTASAIETGRRRL